jgi:hypothetical protein
MDYKVGQRFEFKRADDAESFFSDLDAEGYALRLYISNGRHVVEIVELPCD